MKTRKRSLSTPPANFWRLSRKPAALRKGNGKIALQSYALGANGELVFAGVDYASEISARVAWRIIRNWRRWRTWYDSLAWNQRTDYPAKHAPAVARLILFPVNNPAAQVAFAV
jgi:hypothetical protein